MEVCFDKFVPATLILLVFLQQVCSGKLFSTSFSDDFSPTCLFQQELSNNSVYFTDEVS